MQIPEGIEIIVEWVKEELSKVLKIKFCKFHDFIKRKKLTGLSKVWHNYELLRVKIKYQDGRKTIFKQIIVYPSDVIPYSRKTLDVMEKIARDRFQLKKSRKEMEDKYYDKYGFSFSCLKRTLKKVEMGFERLIVSKIISGFSHISNWLKNEDRSLCQLRILYFTFSISWYPPFKCLLS